MCRLFYCFLQYFVRYFFCTNSKCTFLCICVNTDEGRCQDNACILGKVVYYYTCSVQHLTVCMWTCVFLLYVYCCCFIIILRSICAFMNRSSYRWLKYCEWLYWLYMYGCRLRQTWIAFKKKKKNFFFRIQTLPSTSALYAFSYTH